MRLQGLSFLTASTLLLAACGSSTNSNATSDPLAAAVPDVPGISLEATGAASEDATLSSDASAPDASSSAPNGLEFLPVIRQGIHDLNQAVQQDFAPIAQLISTQGTDIVVGQSKS